MKEKVKRGEVIVNIREKKTHTHTHTETHSHTHIVYQ